ncbi:MAG TPA: hypothetical protein VIF34_04570, partial [Methylocystis sp.]
RRITLNNAMSITPSAPAEISQGGFKTWVNSQRKFLVRPGQFRAEINRLSSKLNRVTTSNRISRLLKKASA